MDRRPAAIPSLALVSGEGWVWCRWRSRLTISFSFFSYIPDLFLCSATALYDYEAVQPDELTFSEGARIEIVKKNPDGWYEGIIVEDGRRGLFPGESEEIQEWVARCRCKILAHAS